MATTEASARVLIIEGDPHIAGLLADLLGDEGYRVAVGAGGQGLAAARADPPGLILLDVMMPGMDGPEVCRRLQADPRTRSVPIVFVTAAAALTAEQLAGCRYAGLIRKPFTLDEVLATVARHLPR
ncbi:MAG: response regulator [Chloroflexota bacterium]|nr:response regulator [Chloroflexota bacterium]